MAVFLSLWDVEDLVHVRFPLLPCDFRENQAGDQEVGAAESGEDVAFKCLHVFTWIRAERSLCPEANCYNVVDHS